MYLYVGKVRVGPLSGYLWLLGHRLYLKLGWRPRDTYFLGNLSDPLSLAARLKRLIPPSSGREESRRSAGQSAGGCVVFGQALQGQPQMENPHVGGRNDDTRRRVCAGLGMANGTQSAEERAQEVGRRGAGVDCEKPPRLDGVSVKFREDVLAERQTQNRGRAELSVPGGRDLRDAASVGRRAWGGPARSRGVSQEPDGG